MITQKLVDKLLGFVGTMPQMQAMQLGAPMAEVRQMMQAPQQLQTAPDLQVFAGLSPQQLPGNTLNFDESKLINLPKVKLDSKRPPSADAWNPRWRLNSGQKKWGNQAQKPGLNGVKGDRGAYASVAIPDATTKYQAQSQETASTKSLKSNAPTWVKDYRFDKDGVKKPGKDQLNGVERGGYVAGSAEQQPNGFLGLSGSSQELAKERSEVPKLMEEDYGEQPDPITVLAVGILSAFVGSAATFALFHFRRSFTKTEMRAPLLN